MIQIQLKINDRLIQRFVPERTTLLEFIREELNLTGTKRGCDTGECGCCTVIMDGEPVLACLILAVEASNRSILTIEGVANRQHIHQYGDDLHPVQLALVNEGGTQCGFCTPAMVMNGVALTDRLDHQSLVPSTSEVKTCISGTICRCTGYKKIEKAIASAAHTCIGRSQEQAANQLKPVE